MSLKEDSLSNSIDELVLAVAPYIGNHQKGTYNFSYTGVGSMIYTRPYVQESYGIYRASPNMVLQHNIVEIRITGTQESTGVPYLGSGYMNVRSKGYQQHNVSLRFQSSFINPFITHSNPFIEGSKENKEDTSYFRDIYEHDAFEDELKNSVLLGSNFSPLDGNMFDLIMMTSNQAGERVGRIVYEMDMNGYVSSDDESNDNSYNTNYDASFAILDLPYELMNQMLKHKDWNKLKMALIAYSNSQYIIKNIVNTQAFTLI